MTVQPMTTIMVVDDNDGFSAACARYAHARGNDISVIVAKAGIAINMQMHGANNGKEMVDGVLLDVRVPTVAQLHGAPAANAMPPTASSNVNSLIQHQPHLPIVVYTNYAGHPDVDADLAIVRTISNVMQIWPVPPTIPELFHSLLVCIHQLDVHLDIDEGTYPRFTISTDSAKILSILQHSKILLNGHKAHDRIAIPKGFVVQFEKDCFLNADWNYLGIVADDGQKTIFALWNGIRI